MANSFQNEQEAPELVMLSELAENLVYRLPGCADVMIRKTLQEVYREFCRETKCLTADRVFDIVAAQADYPVGSRFGGVVGEVREVEIDGLLLSSGRDYNVLPGLYPIVRLAPLYVPPDAESEDESEPTIAPSPWGVAEASTISRTKKLRIKATEYPKMNSEKTPSWFIEKHGDSICSGVLSRLMAMTGKPWSDAQQAADERRNYENAKSEQKMYNEAPAGGRFIDTSMVL